MCCGQSLEFGLSPLGTSVRAPPHKYGLPTDTMALITSDCGATRLREHQTALITSDCAPSRPPATAGSATRSKFTRRQGSSVVRRVGLQLQWGLSMGIAVAASHDLAVVLSQTAPAGRPAQARQHSTDL